MFTVNVYTDVNIADWAGKGGMSKALFIEK